MAKILSAALVILVVSLLTLSVGAAERGMTVVAQYDADAASPAPAPNSAGGGNWTIPVVNGSVVTGPTTDAGHNGWIINDDSDGERLWYKKDLSGSDHNELADGWELQIIFRVTAAGPTENHSLSIWYCNAGFNRWASAFDVNSDGALRIIAQHVLGDGSIVGLEKVVTGNGQGTDSYHTLSIVNTTGSGEARLKFDGNLVTFGTGESAFLPLDLAGETIYVGTVFGAANWTGDGAMIVRSVELHSLPPCPADIAENNSEINVTDLFRLLSNWSTDGYGANLAAPLEVVDVSDLFVLLAAWGTCD